MARARKYKNKAEQVEARRKRQMAYYFRKKAVDNIKGIDEVKKIFENPLPPMDKPNWVAAVLKSVNDCIEWAIDNKQTNAMYLCEVNHVDTKTFKTTRYGLSKEDAELVADILRGKGYTVVPSFFLTSGGKQYLIISGWTDKVKVETIEESVTIDNPMTHKLCADFSEKATASK